MKRLFLLGTLFVMMVQTIPSVTAGPNPIVKRLSAAEIEQCVTPSAVAYNFIESILCRDFQRMLSYCDSKYAQMCIRGWQDNEQFFRAFSAEGGEKLNILGWIPALAKSYEVAIAYVQDVWYYMEGGQMCHHIYQVVKDGMIYLPGEQTPRVGILEKKIYVTCSPTAEINYVGFQDITRYGNTNVKVLLYEVNGVWKVHGFK